MALWDKIDLMDGFRLAEIQKIIYNFLYFVTDEIIAKKI